MLPCDVSRVGIMLWLLQREGGGGGWIPGYSAVATEGQDRLVPMGSRNDTSLHIEANKAAMFRLKTLSEIFHV